MKKGFTLIELLSVIVILAIIALIATPMILGIINKTRIKKYKIEETSMEKAAELYLIDEKKLLEEEILSQEIDLKTLINAKKIKSVYDSGNGNTCEGKVIVTKENSKVNYKGCLKCSNYQTKGCGYEPEIEDKNLCELETETKNNIKYYYIDSEEDLYAFSNSVNSGNNYSGKTVKLRKNLDMSKPISEIQKSCGETVTSFKPIGNFSINFEGVFEGNAYTISKLNINNTSDYTGLFGYSRGIIRGINLKDITIVGKKHAGGLVGYNGGTITDITVSGSVEGNERVGGIVGINSGSIKNSIGYDVNVKGTTYVGGIYGYGNYQARTYQSKLVVYKGKITGNRLTGKIGGENGVPEYAFVSNNVELTNAGDGMQGDVASEEKLSTISFYESFMDTYVGGDNDSSGYYFDYDSSKKLVLKSVERHPFNFNLDGAGTKEKPYLISSVEDWKTATLKTNESNIYFRLTKNLDFNNKQFYPMTNLNGIFEGYGNTLKNMVIYGQNYNTGIFGSNYGTIQGLNVENVYVEGDSRVGGLVGYNRGTIKDITLSGTVKGTENVGGIVGQNSNIIGQLIGHNITVTGTTCTAGIYGYGNYKARTYQSYIIFENGTVNGNKKIGACSGFPTVGTAYSSSNVILNNTVEDNDSNFDSIYINDLGFYNDVVETAYTGDRNGTGYYFDYNSDGSKIITVKAGSVSNNDLTDVTSDKIINATSTTDTEAPICTLTAFKPRGQKDGMTAAFTCTDNIDVANISSYFSETRTTAATSFKEIGTLKPGIKITNGMRWNSIWTAYTDKEHPPYAGKCYYFHYGAEDAQGNFSSYVTNYCLSY